jgi:hypothetical protein
MGYYGEPEMGYYGAEPEAGYYGESPDAVGYAGGADEMGYFAEGPMEGYVRERDISPRVAPVENISGFEGYYTPKSVNPTCETLRPAEKATERSTEWFKPLW